MKTYNKRLNNNATTTTSNGIRFVMSDDSVDRVGDRVDQKSWKLDDFKANSIALFNHNHDAIIGVWKDVQVLGNELVGTLTLAEKGTSPLVDEVSALISQGILKSVSIGFSAGKVKQNSYDGYDLSDCSLLECSVVAIPANQNALRKSLSKHLSSSELDSICSVSGTCGSKSTGDSNSVNADTQTTIIQKEFKMKTLAERIKELQDNITAKRDAIKTIAENEEATDADMEIMTGHTADVEDLEKKLDQFERAEKAVAVKAKDEVVKSIAKKSKTEKGDLATKLFVSIAKAHVAGVSPMEMAEKTYGGDKDVMNFVKATSIPADTTTTGWATELVEDGYGAFLDTLYPATVYGRVAGTPLFFGKYGSIIIPSFSAASNINGEFVAEGAPIPVKQGVFETQTLTPKKLGVITTFTREILTKSTPAVEMLVRNAIIMDTSKAIDAAFLDNAAVSAIRPAGLQNATATGAGNINASVGATVSDILNDVKGVFSRLEAVQLGQKGVWVMNPTTVLGLSTKQIATGQFAFSTIENGSFAGHPIVSSTNVPAGVVFYVDDQALVKGSDIAPEFTVSNQATLVMDTVAEPIVTGGAVTTQDVRSMYQTDTTALRFVLGLDWAIIRVGGVQVLTGVNY